MRHVLLVAAWVVVATQTQAADPCASQYFQIRVVDEDTGRGVPLVELETTNNIRLVTDSAGVVAFLEPGLMDKTVWFTVRSHGYEHAKDGFGSQGKALKVTPGGKAELKVKRINIAERLYRVTGGGIYRDSVLLGLPTPITEPVLNGQVLGCDSVMSLIYKGKIFWIWGDTNQPKYPLGNFDATGAISELPGKGGLDPSVGVNFKYFVKPDGFVKGIAPIPGKGPTWPFAPVVLKVDGRERMFAGYGKIRGSSMETYERGLCVWNDETEQFEKVAEWRLDHPVVPTGHAFRGRVNGVEYIYFAAAMPLTRVRAKPELLKNLDNFETFTCLKEGSTMKNPQLDRDSRGRLRYSWKRNTPAVYQKEQDELIAKGLMKKEEALIQLHDVETGQPVLAHAGTVHWNAYRRKWIMIVCQQFGTSVLGETWYAEAPTPTGPWGPARKIVTHNEYSFYNPRHHPFFDQEGGRIIYFEGTYTHSFSGNKYQTPRYDYNQVMYRLDLADPRLKLPPASPNGILHEQVEPVPEL